MELAIQAMNEVKMKSATADAAEAFVDAYRRAYLKELRAGARRQQRKSCREAVHRVQGETRR